MNKRKSYYLTQLLQELRKRASKEKDEDKRRDYWRLYYKALHAENEVREMVMDAEIRRLLEIVLAYGMLPDTWKDEIDKLDDNANESKPPPVDDIDDNDIPPRQKGFWEE
jgi:hypothetical protein